MEIIEGNKLNFLKRSFSSYNCKKVNIFGDQDYVE